MIFYFSATGNSRYVARRLAEATDDRLVSVPELLREGRTEFTVRPEERVGFVFPTYFWGLPDLAGRFLEALTLHAPEGTYFYLIATYGSTPGAVGAFAQRLMRRKGYSLDSRCSVRMPDTWTPIFDLSDKEKVAATNTRAEEEIARAVEVVRERRRGDFMARKIPFPIAQAFARPLYALQRSTAGFTVSDECIGCGLCERQCPDGAIQMQGGRPIWVKKKCEICLGCLHRCPKFAIRFGSETARHGQYQNPHETGKAPQ